MQLAWEGSPLTGSCAQNPALSTTLRSVLAEKGFPFRTGRTWRMQLR